MSAPSRVLIVRLSSIGDVVHALPAYVELTRAWPSARFGWAVEPAARDLVAVLDAETHLVPTPEFRRRPLSVSTARGLLAVRRELRARRYDLVVDFQGLLKSAALARLAGAAVVGHNATDAREPLAARLYQRVPPPRNGHEHAVEKARRLASFATGVPPGPLTFPRLTTPAAESKVGEELDAAGVERFALLHVAANWDSKRYPRERWIEVAREIHAATGLTVLWSWGPGERPVVEDMAREAGRGSVVSFPTTLPELVALISRARVHVGGDSAPLHLAVACGTPVVGLFGPTDPGSLGPLDPADGVVRRVLECSHCHQRVCPLGTRACLEELPASSIVSAVTARLGQAPLD